MLMEMKDVRQIPREGFRRWFSDENFDLFIWYDDEKEIQPSGFQLSYDKQGYERALTFHENKGYRHDGIDSGEEDASINRSPVLVQDGEFAFDSVIQDFETAAEKIDPEIRKWTLEKLRDYK